MTRRTSVLLIPVVTAAAGLVSLLVLTGATHTIIAGDPGIFRSRMVEILGNGRLPYLEAPFEHLPLMLVPMGLAWYLGGSVSDNDYVFVFALLMIACLVTTGQALIAIGERLGLPATGARWLLLLLPVMPLVVFRNDPFVVMLFAIGLLTMLRSPSSSTGWAIAGGLAKIWPATLGLLAFRHRRVLQGTTVSLAGALGIALTMHQGFAETRDAVGIHAETLVGGIVGLARAVSGQDVDVTITTAAYLPVLGWMVALNALIGLVVALVGARLVGRARDDLGAVLSLGVVVVGLILTSPLFSLQYLLWIVPFVALTSWRSTRFVGLTAGLVTTGLAWVWRPDLFEAAPTYLLITARNVLVLALAAQLAAEVRSDHAGLNGQGQTNTDL